MDEMSILKIDGKDYEVVDKKARKDNRIQYYDLKLQQSELNWSLEGGGWYSTTYPIDENIVNKKILLVTLVGFWANGSWDNVQVPCVMVSSDQTKLRILAYGRNNGLAFTIRIIYHDKEE